MGGTGNDVAGIMTEGTVEHLSLKQMHRGMQAVYRCCNKMLHFLTGMPGNLG